jgi:hypothetical protein
MKQIDLEKIPQKSIRSFIQEQMGNNINAFSDLQSTYSKGQDLSTFRIHEKIYKVGHPPEKVWDHYMNANPNEVWNGAMLSFGLMVSKNDGGIMYIGEEYNGAKVGQVFYISLNIFGLVNVAVSHEMISIVPEKKYFELSYVEGSKSKGKQRITFFKTSDGNTRIVHTTYYKSDSDFRDNYIYPFFHTKAIGEYHDNMIQSLS